MAGIRDISDFYFLTTIKLAATENAYKLEDRTWLSYSIKIQGPSSLSAKDKKPVLVLGKDFVIDSTVYQGTLRTFVDFERVRIENSSIMIGDARVTFRDSELHKVIITQEYITQRDIEFYEVSIENCVITESDISARPKSAYNDNWGTTEHFYQPYFASVINGNLTIKNSSIQSTNINITAVHLSAVIEDSVFNNEDICSSLNGLMSTKSTFNQTTEKQNGCEALLRERSIRETGLHLGVGVHFLEEREWDSLKDVNNAPPIFRVFNIYEQLHRSKRSAGTQNETEEIPSESIKLPNSIQILNTIFDGMTSTEEPLPNEAALTIASHSDLTFLLRNSAFTNNNRALNIELWNNQEGSIDIKSTNFTSNNGYGPGGAVHLYQVNGRTAVTIESCNFINNTASRLQNRKISAEFSKVPGSGGAVTLNVVNAVERRCTAFIRLCTFRGMA